ncbi:MAG TPA: SDR family oxidoreductase [Gemmatimonadaceae bacterium]|nr:SDR family oxidoreductase [Gemmatimonadaceae bacterium]
MHAARSVLITGATGLLGRSVLTRLLSADSRLRAFVLVRDIGRWSCAATELTGGTRVLAVQGDLCAAGLGLAPDVRATISRDATAIVHLAADTTFSSPLDRARAVNTLGTQRVLELASDCESPVRVAFVSTAFVAGRRTGVVAEDAGSPAAGWVNAYEQSKYEAEQLVREQACNWVIARPSTVVCDDLDGQVSQVNAVHRALHLYRRGLVAMMPGVAGSTVDAITTSYVADGIARLALRDDAAGKTVHLCAGAGALPLDELLDVTYERWATDRAWRKRGVVRPAITDLATYALFERTIDDVGDASLKRITRALAHFVPQLALPKCFDTTNADKLLGHAAPPVRDFWRQMLDHMVAARGAVRPLARVA